MSALTITRLVLVERSKRIAALIVFALIFLAAALAGRLLSGDEGMGALYLVGGQPMVAAMIMLGWLIGRFPLIATIVLLAGVFSADREQGYARIYGVRPVSFIKLYGTRAVSLGFAAFLLSVLLLPLFDVVLLSELHGIGSMIVLIACYVVVYTGVVSLLSVFTRGEGWIALALAVVAMIWDALRRGSALNEAPPGVREAVSFVLPPEGPLFRIAIAFGELQPIPWVDVAYVCGYGFVLLLAAAVFVMDREF